MVSQVLFYFILLCICKVKYVSYITAIYLLLNFLIMCIVQVFHFGKNL